MDATAKAIKPGDKPGGGLGPLDRQPTLLLVLTSLMWGANAVAGRMAVGELSPMVLTAGRWVIPAALMSVLARREIAAAWPLLRRRLPRIAIMGTLGFTAFNAFLYAAAYRTSAVNIAILQGSIPVFVLLGALAVHRSRIGWSRAAGMAAALLGVAVVATKGDLATLLGFAFNLGDLWMLIACLCYAAYTLALRDRPRAPPLAFFAVLAMAGFITSLPLLAYEAATGAAQWPTPKGLGILVFIGLFPSLLGQVFFMRGVELIGPGRAGMFVNLVPVFGALLAVIVLGEPFHGADAAALALVLGGIWLAERGR